MDWCSSRKLLLMEPSNNLNTKMYYKQGKKLIKKMKVK